MKRFDVLDIRLKGSNLIEASAGTGKTYSLAILAVRLICESNMSLKQILMVTCTNAATAELEVRIRRFVREAYRYIIHKQCSDKTIKSAVDKAIGITDYETVRKNLENAVRNLDETSVMTIHSFCQSTLGEFQFETEQVDKTEVVKDLSDLVEFEINEFWRKEISVLHPVVLHYLTDYLSKEKISTVIHKVLNNKSFIGSTDQIETDLETVKSKHSAYIDAKDEYRNHVLNNFGAIVTRASAKKTAVNFLQKKCQNDPKKFLTEFIKVRENEYSKEVFSEERELLIRIDNALGEIKALMQSYSIILLSLSVDAIIPEIKAKLKRLNLVSFNDLISSVHTAMQKGKLAASLNNKFKAIFIDEFQDTDKLQYEIFDRIFHGQAVIFYIGDPKQSIFGWRSADMPTYLEARKKVGEENCYSMDSNYRSTPQMIAAMNKFFRPTEDFDAFSSKEIVYRETLYPENLSETAHGELLLKSKPVVPLTVINKENNDQIADFTGSEILRLLTDKDFIIRDNNGQAQQINPSDITVLVRTGKQGKLIKSRLADLGVPAITIDDQKVLESEEVKLIKKIMTAVMRPNRKSINSLLADDLLGYDLKKLRLLDDEKLLGVFTRLNGDWLESGIFNVLSAFLNEFNLIEKWLSQEGTRMQRSLTNIFQIMEILHDTEMKKKLKPDELYVWFEKATHAPGTEDEYLQRIESDENAVRIMTIHKCKGLTFKIVFNPFLDFYRHPVDNGITYRDEDGQYYFTYNPDVKTVGKYDKQILQENKRLLYVAMTRAVYKNYINSNNSSPNSELKEFLSYYAKEEQRENVKDLFEFNPDVEFSGIAYKSKNARVKSVARPAPVKTFDKTWGMHSFSSLTHKHEAFTSEETDFMNDYDRFVFDKMPRGEKTGLFLHSIFEHLDFTDRDGYGDVLESAGEYYSSVYKAEHRNLYLELVGHCMNVKIDTKDGGFFSLNEVKNECKLPELEFYFSLDRHQKSKIAGILKDVEFTTDTEIEGIMHGFIDLLFEHNNKYYILDWKSNFLGNRIEDYGEQGCLEGMRANNYHLQYHIYTVAVKRFLEKKLKNFDYVRDFGGVIYMFLRGVRENDGTTGIYFEKPGVEKMNALESLFNG